MECRFALPMLRRLKRYSRLNHFWGGLAVAS